MCRARCIPNALGLLALGLTLAACGNAVSLASVAAADLPYADLGELEDHIQASSTSSVEADRLDTDGDSLPDVVEDRLGTDPRLADTDRDGLVDNHELFQQGWARSDPLPDHDRDGLIAPLDSDDDGDRVNDGMSVDTDGDGVPNYHELYGYTFDVLTNQFRPWTGDPDVPHYFTDPLQASTDQDAYSDATEVSRALLDPTVEHPGDDPLVPAYPNIVVELISYSVTLNEDIQITESQSLSQGQNWSRQTEQSHSFGVQTNWEVGGEYAFGPTGGAKVSAKFGQQYQSTNSTSTSVAVGESVATDEGWSQARSTNPTRAAVVKLYLKVHNRGTAPISNMVPTLSLKIGGLNVATFEPAGSDVNLLVPGATYPAEPGWLWVVEAKNTGGGTEPLYLTMSELRALERGAPISLSAPQIVGDAMRLASGGTWESVGDTNEFSARCDAVCANLRIELEDGTLIHHMVYADDAPTAPSMTLGQALGKLGVGPDGALHYADENGTPIVQPLQDFNFGIDPATLRANGWTIAADDPSGNTTTTAPPGFVLAEMRLLPDSVVYLRAPRPAAAPPEPIVHFATLDPDTGEILVSAADYEGIARVVVHNQYDPLDVAYHEQLLRESVPGAGFFTGDARGPEGFAASDELTAEVTNLGGLGRRRDLGSLFVAPGPQKPVIHEATLDLDALRLYARVESGNPDNPNSNIQWIRAYHPDFAGGYAEMDRVYDYYRDPLGHETPVPPNFGDVHDEDIEVVAFVNEQVLEIAHVSIAGAAAVAVRRQGTYTLTAAADGDLIGRNAWDITKVLLDANPGTGIVSKSTVTQFAFPALPGAPSNVALIVDASTALAWGRFYWNAEYKVLDVGGLDVYRTLSRDDVVALDAEITSRDTQKVGNSGGADLRPGDVVAIRTIQGRHAKIYVETVSYHWNAFFDRMTASVTIRYVVWAS